MNIKLSINYIIIIALLLVFYRLYVLKFFYLLVVPGFFIIRIFRSDYDLNKSLLFSFPLSLIFYVFPYFLITRLGLPINYVLYLLLPALMLAYLVYSKKVSFSFSSSINLTHLVMSLIILGGFFFVFSPYSFKDNAIPLTEASNEYRSILDIRDNIISRGVVPRWNYELYSGGPLFFMAPPITPLSIAFLSLIPTEAFYVNFNLSYTFPLLYLLFSSFLLFRKFGLSLIASSMATFLVAGAPLLVGELTYAGNATSAFMLSLYPIALYGFFSLFDEKDRKDFVIYGLAFASFFLAYHFNFYFTVLPMIPVCIVFFFIVKNKKLFLSNCFYFFSVAAIVILSWFVNNLAVSSFVELSTFEGDWAKPLSSLSDFINIITYSGNTDISKMMFTLSPVFFYVGLISSFVALRLKSKSFFKIDLAVLLFLIFVLSLILVEILPFHTILPLRSKFYTAYRFWFNLVPLFAFGIGRLIDYVSSRVKGFNFLFLFLIPLLFSGMFLFSSNNANVWLKEKAIVDESTFSVVYDLVNASNGRVASFGIFGPAMIPAISRWTGASMFSGYNFERFSTKYYYMRVVRPLMKASEDFIYDSVSPVRVYNTFREAWVSTLIFNRCNPNGLNAYNKTLTYPSYEPIFLSECVDVYTLLNNSFYAEGVVLSTVAPSVNKSEFIDGLMDVPHYTIVFTADDLNESFTNVFSSLNESYVWLNKPLGFSRVSDDEIIVRGYSGYVLVRESYFPTWHAFQDGKEIPVFPSYYGFMIVKSSSDSDIRIVSLPYYSEILGFFIFVVVCFVCGAVFFWKK